MPIKIIIGLGNPGHRFTFTRHNIGFLVLDALADKYNALWSTKGDKEVAEIDIPVLRSFSEVGTDHHVTLVKPQTFMNNSGKVIPSLLKQGLTVESLLVVHDELEKPFGVVDIKTGGSHRGHNGLRSIISICGAEFARVRCGIGRPDRKEDVADYVLSNFSEDDESVKKEIDKAISLVEQLIAQ